jgi:large subunit ribosomal protein L4
MATSLPVLDNAGKQIDGVDLQDNWLERDKGDQAVHDTVVAYMAAKRAGTASSKNRSKVRASGSKPYRQKGTGRARAGNSSSPLWRGGGTIFGPTPRDFSKRVNRKVRRLALRRAFTARVDEDAIVVVDDIALPAPKTRELTALLKAVGAGSDVLVVVQDVSPELKLAARNLPGVQVVRANTVNTYWLLLFKKIVITRAALEALGSQLCAQEKGT